MIVEKVFPSGMWCVSEIINGELVTRRYDECSKQEAVEFFEYDTHEMKVVGRMVHLEG